MDYISLKHDVTDLDKQASDWKRKLELLQVCVIVVKSQWVKLASQAHRIKAGICITCVLPRVREQACIG